MSSRSLCVLHYAIIVSIVVSIIVIVVKWLPVTTVTCNNKTWFLFFFFFSVYVVYTSEQTDVSDDVLLNHNSLNASSLEDSCPFLVYTYETWRVIVTDGLGVSVCLKYGITLNDLLFQRTNFCHLISTHKGKQGTNTWLLEDWCRSHMMTILGRSHTDKF